MVNTSTSYSQQSARKTLVFVITLIVIAIALSFIVIYMMHKQSTVLIQSAPVVEAPVK
jgi:preprotein translocase subunit SecY